MRKGEKRVVRTRCCRCGDQVVVRIMRHGVPFTPAEVADMMSGYVCWECVGDSTGVWDRQSGTKTDRRKTAAR
jgi:hypothetical protein